MAHLEEMAARPATAPCDPHTGVRQDAAVRSTKAWASSRSRVFAPYEDDPLSRCYAKQIG